MEILFSFTDLLLLHRAYPDRYPFLLETSKQPIDQPGFDILFAFPQETLVSNAGDAKQNFLQRLDAAFAAIKMVPLQQQEEVPFQGGWFVYLGYELAQEIEPSLKLPDSGSVGPRAFATRCPAAIIRDHRQHRLLLVAENDQPAFLAQMKQDLLSISADAIEASFIPVKTIQEADPARWLQAVESIHRYVREGDVFQVNLSRSWDIEMQLPVQPWQLYAKLRDTNPAPFSGLAVQKGFSIISSSPERLVRVRNGIVDTRPIAGTRPRGTTAEADEALQQQLMQDSKERAEHVMLIDLERNDVGRISVPGSVKVTELMGLETYAHVHHIVSNVQGILVDGVSPGDVIRALFPGGTITGCPKVRCMEIIAELEQEPRGVYTGSMGYLNRDGSMDLNILIRTFSVTGDQICFRAGGGIVQDSIGERELAETRAKAKGLLAVFSNE